MRTRAASVKEIRESHGELDKAATKVWLFPSAENSWRLGFDSLWH